MSQHKNYTLYSVQNLNPNSVMVTIKYHQTGDKQSFQLSRTEFDSIYSKINTGDKPMSIFEQPHQISHEQRLQDQLSRSHNKPKNNMEPPLSPAQKRKIATLQPTDKLIFLRNLKQGIKS